MHADRPAFGETEFFKKTYKEAISLVHMAAEYFENNKEPANPTLSDEATLVFTAESLRMTSRLTQIMAWLFVQRAIAAGEIPPEEASVPARRLSGHSTCLPEETVDTSEFPETFTDLLNRSEGLFRRIARLDEMVASDAA